MPQQNIPIQFPLKGLNRKAGYQSSDLATTTDAINVFPDDSKESRTRGGLRPGLTRRYPQIVGGNVTVMLPVSTADALQGEGYQFLAVGSDSNLYVSSAVKSGESYPVTYVEQLNQVADQSINVNRFQAVAYKGKIIVAGGGTTVASGVANVVNNSLTSGDISNWEDINASKHVVNVTSDTGFGTYQIETVSESSLTVISTTVLNLTGATVAIVDAAIEIDPQNATAKPLVSSKGVIPSKATAIAVYRDRLVWAEDRVWYMSRQGDITDYDYGGDADDGGRAVAGVNSPAGQPGDPIVAMAVGGDDYLVMFAEDTIWVLRGDPTYGGKLYNLSTVVGCIGPRAWCYGAQDEIYFMSKSGLFFIDSEVDNPPQSISDLSLPNELKQVTSTNFIVSMAYDSADSGIAIFLTPRDGSNGTHWWFDIQTTSLWPMQMTLAAQQPVAVCSFSGNASRQQRLLLASKDGYLREFTGLLDDGQEIMSHLILGPYPMTQDPSLDGILTEVLFYLGEFDANQTTITASVFAAATAEESVRLAKLNQSPMVQYQLSDTPSRRIRDRLRGAYFCVRLDCEGPWSYESAIASVTTTGRQRALV